MGSGAEYEVARRGDREVSGRGQRLWLSEAVPAGRVGLIGASGQWSSDFPVCKQFRQVNLNTKTANWCQQ